MVNRLKDLNVQRFSLRRIERYAQNHEGVSKTLHTNTNWAMTKVGPPSLGRGVEVDVDNLVEIICDDFGHVVQLFEVIDAVGNEGRKSN